MKILITGISSGIGKETALKFLKEGWCVIGLDIQPKSINDFCYHRFVCDVSKKEQLPELDSEVMPAVVVNNAGTLSEEDEDFLFLNDDDVMFYDYYGILNLFDEIKKHPEKFKDVDAFYPIAPQYEPFKKLVYEDSRNLDFWKFAKSPINHPGSQMILRNIKKFKGIEIYQDESLNPGKGTGNENVEFMLEWLKKGLIWCQLQTWIQKNLGMSKSIVFSEKEERKTGIIQSNLKSLCLLHSDDGLIWDEKKNHPIYKEFNKRWNKTPGELLVKREKSIEFSKKEIPDGGLEKAEQMRLF